MTYRNPGYIALNDLRAKDSGDPKAYSLDLMTYRLRHESSYRVHHPALISSYAVPHRSFRTKPLPLVGLDIETDAETGEVMLLGLAYASGKVYQVERPTFAELTRLLGNISRNAYGTHLACWGMLDIQAILRLFGPTSEEAQRLTQGIAPRIRKGAILSAPMQRGKWYAGPYIHGRALKVGYAGRGFDNELWIFNTSQFWSGQIAEAATKAGIEWRDYGKDAHVIDWDAFAEDNEYRLKVLAANAQDARAARDLAMLTQERLYQATSAYPRLLISNGSLTDAATSAALSNEEYQACSFEWLMRHVWQDEPEQVKDLFRALCSEAYSAGIIAHYAVGYFEGNVHHADMASAYPAQIRKLHDLWWSRLVPGMCNLAGDIAAIERGGATVETAIVRGRVTIPRTLRYHPITVKTRDRMNMRPTGTFWATYTREERDWCRARGARFEAKTETYVIVALREVHPAPIAALSESFGAWRRDGNDRLAKITDNALYGKMLTTRPSSQGQVASDRYNLLWATVITARTRVAMCEALTHISEHGGRPILSMTDGVWWKGKATALPTTATKTPGHFSAIEYVSALFVLRSGQYEYKIEDKWHYRLRGLQVDSKLIAGSDPFYRPLVQAALAQTSDPFDVSIPIPTTRLAGIGGELEHLGTIQNQTIELQPFVIHGSALKGWQKCADDHIWLSTPHIGPMHPLAKAHGYAALSDAYATQAAANNADNGATMRDLRYRKARLEKEIQQMEEHRDL